MRLFEIELEKDAKPSWKRFGSGTRTLVVRVNDKAEWVELSIRERSTTPGEKVAEKVTHATLDTYEVDALIELLGKRLIVPKFTYEIVYPPEYKGRTVRGTDPATAVLTDEGIKRAHENGIDDGGNIRVLCDGHHGNRFEISIRKVE